jgi:hypothetical protein
MRIALLAAVAATVTVAPVLAQNTARPKASARTSERKICRQAVATGTIMPLRSCRTQAEWDAITARSQADLGRARTMDRARESVQGR